MKSLNKIWYFLSSVKLTVVVLLSLAATSIIGTFIPQNANPEWYQQKFGAIGFKIFTALQISDMYHSLWFRMLIAALTVNIIICSIDRLSTGWKIIFTKNPKFSLNRFKKLKDQNEFFSPMKPEDLQPAYMKFFKKRFSFCMWKKSENGFIIFAEKGRKARLGVYVVHTSVVLLLIGGLIGSLAGFDGYVNINEGESTGKISLNKSNNDLDLGFKIRCDKFSVSYYDTGAPKEYRSDITIIDQGKPVLQKSILVNSPLHYKGINIFQSGYNEIPPDEADISFFNKTSGKAFQVKAKMNKAVDLPGGKGKFILTGFRKSYITRGRRFGKSFLGTYSPAGGGPIDVIMPYPFPSFNIHDQKNMKMMSILQFSRTNTDNFTAKTTFLFSSKDTGMTYSRDVELGRSVQLPEGLGKFTLNKVAESYSFMGHDMGRTLLCTIEKKGEPKTVALPLKFAGFDKMRGGDVVISLANNRAKTTDSGFIISATDYTPKYYTGLQVTKDPGVWFVYSGFILMIIGCFITFYISHQSICIDVSFQKKKSKIIVTGFANKNKLAMDRKVKNLADRLKKLTVS